MTDLLRANTEPTPLVRLPGGRGWTLAARVAFWACSVLFAVACCLPALHDGDGFFSLGEVPGFACLVLGWLTPPWYANVLLLAAGRCVSLERVRAGTALGVAACLLSVTTLLFESVS